MKNNISSSKTKKISFILMTISTVLFILTFSISLPIVIRPFYYAHVDIMDIPSHSGYAKDNVINAYDEMLDYCLGKSNDFSTGTLAFSKEGKAHFDDVKILFFLNFVILIISFAVLLYYFISIKTKKRTYVTIKNKGPLFWGSMLLSLLFIIIFTYIVIDFDGAFVAFHNLFFPGKSNWLFDRKKDQIINILPEIFFRNCAIFALISICTLIAISLFLDKRISKN